MSTIGPYLYGSLSIILMFVTGLFIEDSLVIVLSLIACGMTYLVEFMRHAMESDYYLNQYLSTFHTLSIVFVIALWIFTIMCVINSMFIN